MAEINKKHNQHTVWKHYLKPWTTSGKLYCLHNHSKKTHQSLNNLGVKRKFYTVDEWTDSDAEFIKEYIIDRLENAVKPWAINYLVNYIKPFEKRKLCKQLFGEDSEKFKTSDIEVYNNAENLHHNIENIGRPYLEKLYISDTSFYSNEHDRRDFYAFVMVQYLRTRKIKERLIEGITSEGYPQLKPITPNIANTWPIATILLAMNSAHNLTYNVDTHLQLIHNNSNIPFITSDQPTINLKSKNGNLDDVIDELELYYPITPNIAIIISEGNKSLHPNQLTEDAVQNLNDAIASASHMQVYSNKEHILDNYIT